MLGWCDVLLGKNQHAVGLQRGLDLRDLLRVRWGVEADAGDPGTKHGLCRFKFQHVLDPSAMR